MLLSIEGDEKTAKTTTAYTAPLPIVGFQFDIGQQRAINGTQFNKYFKGLDIHTVKYNRIKPQDNLLDPNNPPWVGHDITIFELPAPVQLDSSKHEGYIALWDYFISRLGLAAGDGSVSSIVLDTATIARRIRIDAYLEELNRNAANNGTAIRKQLLQIEYGHPNDSIRNIYQTMASLNKNFVATHHLTDEYVPAMVNGSMTTAPSGKKVLEGLSGSARLFDVCIRNDKGSKGEINSTIVTCGYNLALEGMKIPNLDWNTLIAMIEGSLENRIELDKRVMVGG